MKKYFKYILVFLFGALFWGIACKKENPKPTNGDSRLTNPYCNDPNAVNYNWGFPGKPDNTVCIYPVDTFLGTWQFQDSIFDVDSSFLSFQSKTLIFTASEDTMRIHLAIQGWCPSEKLYAVANKYGNAIVDTLAGNFKGQIICNQQDSISGSFSTNTYKIDSMRIGLTVNNSSGTQYHIGWAIKQ